MVLTSLRISPCARLSSHELSARARPCPPECSAIRRHRRKSASFSFETAALSEVFPLARLLFSKTFRPPFHLAHSGKEMSLRAPSFPPTTRQTRIIAANGVKDQGGRGERTGRKAFGRGAKQVFRKNFDINLGGGSGVPAGAPGGPGKRAGSMPVRQTGRESGSARRASARPRAKRARTRTVSPGRFTRGAGAGEKKRRRSLAGMIRVAGCSSRVRAARFRRRP
jgi:hypothetical protein